MMPNDRSSLLRRRPGACVALAALLVVLIEGLWPVAEQCGGAEVTIANAFDSPFAGAVLRHGAVVLWQGDLPPHEFIDVVFHAGRSGALELTGTVAIDREQTFFGDYVAPTETGRWLIVAGPAIDPDHVFVGRRPRDLLDLGVQLARSQLSCADLWIAQGLGLAPG